MNIFVIIENEFLFGLKKFNNLYCLKCCFTLKTNIICQIIRNLDICELNNFFTISVDMTQTV